MIGGHGSSDHLPDVQVDCTGKAEAVGIAACTAGFFGLFSGAGSIKARKEPVSILAVRKPECEFMFRDWQAMTNNTLRHRSDRL